MDFFDTLLAEKLGGGGGGSSVTVEELSVTQNGTYTAPTGKAYSPVNVNVSGGSSVEAKDVNFYDYDGTLLHSYTAEEFADLQELPENPSHDGLTAQGWNWTKVDITSQLTNVGGVVNVGQSYLTNSGDTEVDISLAKPLSINMTFGTNGTIVIDWGDDSPSETVTGGSLTTKINRPHSYSSAGSYTIKIRVTERKWCVCGIGGYTGSGGYGGFINQGYNAIADNVYACCTVNNIRLGDNTSIYAGAFNYFQNLETITIPTSTTTITGESVFSFCYSLKGVTYPSGITNGSSHRNNTMLEYVSLSSTMTTFTEANMFYGCSSLKSITIPYGVTTLPNSCIRGCQSLKSVVMPNTITSIGTYAFAESPQLQTIKLSTALTTISTYCFDGCRLWDESITIPNGVTEITSYSLRDCGMLLSITLPSGLTRISSNALNGCYRVREMHFKSTTPPTLANSGGVLSVLSAYCVFYVPFESVDTYKTATNWSTFASRIQGE